MSKFALYLEQDGGCDYTIACGYLLHPLEAATWQEALAEARELLFPLDPDEAHWSDVDRVRLLELTTDLTVPLKEWKQEQSAARKAAEASQAEEKERAEYTRLANKYGGKQ